MYNKGCDSFHNAKYLKITVKLCDKLVCFHA